MDGTFRNAEILFDRTDFRANHEEVKKMTPNTLIFIPDDATRSAAAATLASAQWASVGLLQRRFKLGYAKALDLMAALEGDGIVSALRPDGNRLLRTAPDFSIFAEQVFETALYFHEMERQQNVGDTRAIRLLSPYPTGAVRVRTFMRGLYQNEGLSLKEAALRLAQWNPDGAADPYSTSQLGTYIGHLCDDHAAIVLDNPWPTDAVERAFYRLARYLHREWAQTVPGNSRVFESFIAAAYVPRGQSHRGGGHAEHVVPCQYLRTHCIGMFQAGATLHDVARTCGENLAIVDIHPEEKDRLDRSVRRGGLGLKVAMPAGWSVGKGCVFERLHRAGIAFDPPASMAACDHRNGSSPCH